MPDLVGTPVEHKAQSLLSWFRVKQLLHADRRRLIRKLFRYAVVGMVALLTYNLLVWYTHERYGLSPMLSSVAGYIATLPGAYLGHRNYTFRSHAAIGPELKRFLIAVVFSFIVALLTMFILVNVFALPTMIGAVTATMLIPAGNFVIYNTAVFITAAETIIPPVPDQA